MSSVAESQMLDYFVKQLPALQSSSTNWFIAHNTCRLMRLCAFAATIFLLIQLKANIGHFNHFDEYTAKLGGAIVGSIIGIYVFHKGKQHAQIQARNFRDQVNAIECAIKSELTKDSKIVHFFKKIDKFIYQCVKSLCIEGNNRAKRKDISKCIDNRQNNKLAQFAFRHGIIISPMERLSPGGGVCFGSSLDFVQRYLKCGDVHKVMKEFQGGAPLSAVLLHGQVNRFFDECLLYHKPFSPSELSIKWAGLEAATQSDFAFENAPHHLNEGVYELCFSKKGWGSAHSIIVIKREERYYLFDSNMNQLIEQTTFEGIIQKLAKYYRFSKNADLEDLMEITQLIPKSDESGPPEPESELAEPVVQL